MRWIIADSYLKSLLSLTPEDTRTYLNNPLTNVQGNANPRIPDGWTSTPQGHYTSWASLARDISSGAVTASSLPVVLYDDERWSKTPEEEQRNPCQSMEQFTKLAHAHGFITNLAPDQNLAGSLVGITTYQGGETQNWQSYLRLGLATCAARTGTERFHVMSQPFESRWGPTPEGTAVGGESDFVNFVTQAALQAWAVNPKLVITCGLSANKR